MGARGDCVPGHGVVARAWLAGCLRATSGNTADTAWQYCPGSRSDTPPRQALVRLGLNEGARPADVSQRSSCRRGKFGRFSLETLIRHLARLQHRDITVARGCRTPKSRAHVTTRLGERGPVPGAQAGAILPGSIGSIARGCAEGIGARSTRAMKAVARALDRATQGLMVRPTRAVSRSASRPNESARTPAACAVV